MPLLLAVTGLAAEARVARRAGFAAITGGADAARTAALTAALPAGTACLVSFGIAGGLMPGLTTGAVVLSGEVEVEGEPRRASAAMRRRIAALAGEIGAVSGPVYGAEAILATAGQKAAAHARTGALAIDLESGAVARAALAAGLDFVVLRAIADEAGTDLPRAALLPLTRGGRPALGRILAELLSRPGQIGELVALGRATRRALRALVGPARALHRCLGVG